MNRTPSLRWFVRLHFYRLIGKKRVALASFLPSGNTWLRFMIEQATGKPSGSVYQDRVLPHGKEGVVIKTHRLDSVQYTHAIHLVRNPFDAIESYFHYKKEIAGETDLTWDEHVKQSVQRWRAHTEHWLEARCSVYRVRYEDLRKDTVNELKELLLWLGHDLPLEKLVRVVEASTLDMMRETQPDLGPRFFRRGEVGSGMQEFTVEQRHFVIETLGDLLRACGYEELLQVW